jgi:hypothetical protein
MECRYYYILEQLLTFTALGAVYKTGNIPSLATAYLFEV